MTPEKTQQNPCPQDIPGYTIINKIGEGGMAKVFLAIQKGFEREIALKVLSLSELSEKKRADFYKRFQREAKIVGQLVHPNIVSVYDVGVHQNKFYLAMELLRGGELKSRIKQGITPQKALQITKQIALALDTAHQQAFIHRDIKPQNILFRNDETAVLTDFGIARALEQEGSVAAINKVGGVTEVAMVIGSPKYMSLEQALGRPLDHQTDIYSLGVVLYEMLTGHTPSTAKATAEMAITNKTVPALPQLPKSLSKYQQLLDKMLTLQKADRFQSAKDVANEIDQILAIQSNLRPENNKTLKPRTKWQLGGVVVIFTVGLLSLINFMPEPNILPSTTQLLLTPPQAQIYVPELDRTINALSELTVGSHSIYIYAKGYRSLHTNINLPNQHGLKLSLLPIENPTAIEFYAFEDIFNQKNPDIQKIKQYIATYPHSLLTDLAKAYITNNPLLISQLQQKSQLSDTSATLILSELYDRGWGVDKNEIKAKKLTKRTSGSEFAFAKTQLALLLMSSEPNNKDIISLLKEAASDQFFLAESLLGTAYINGKLVSKNITTGIDYLERAANHQDRNALFNLGQLYKKTDPVKSKTYINKAALLGHPIASKTL